MRKCCALMLIMGLFASCSEEQTPNESTIYEKEFYAVLNDLIRMKLINTSVIHQKTKPVYRTFFGEDSSSNDPSTPPPPFIIYYNSRMFDSWITDNKLDSVNAEYMYRAIDSTRIVNIDSSRVIVPVILEAQLIKIFRSMGDKGYDIIKDRYGTSCVIQVSTPVFNSNFTKVILSIDYNCGPKGGQGHLFILEKRKGLWWLMEDVDTWES